MITTIGQLLLMLILILVAAEIFTNALEHLGDRLGISEGVTGSLFAAVGTAMPESIIPLIALFAGTQSQQINEEIGVGAILGAPLMLSTLSLSLMGAAALQQRGIQGHLHPERTGLARDLNFFLVAFGLAALVLFIPHQHDAVRIGLSVLLVVIYFIYVLMTLRVSARLVEDGHVTQAHSELFFCRFGMSDNMQTILLQLAGALALLVIGADGFVDGVEEGSKAFGISALLLSLLVVPVATELPEKINSILWIRRHKDTLAFGNITGAMVFQGTLLPAMGIMLTPWTPQPEVYFGIAVTYTAAVWLRFRLEFGFLRVWHLGINGLLYLTYLTLVLR